MRHRRLCRYETNTWRKCHFRFDQPADRYTDCLWIEKGSAMYQTTWLDFMLTFFQSIESSDKGINVLISNQRQISLFKLCPESNMRVTNRELCPTISASRHDFLPTIAAYHSITLPKQWMLTLWWIIWFVNFYSKLVVMCHKPIDVQVITSTQVNISTFIE